MLMFRRQLGYKAQPSLTKVVAVGRWFPPCRLCMKCGTLQGRLTLNDRTFKRDGCGHVEDRDLHAARNLERCPGFQGNPCACGHQSTGRSGRLTGETRVGEAGMSRIHVS